MHNTLFSLLLSFALTGCAIHSVRDVPKSADEERRSNFGSIFKKNPLVLKSHKKQTRTLVKGPCSVNKYLWRGALETIGFMPIISAIPSQGRIVTGWYSAEEEPNIRVRVIVSIIGNELRADAVKVIVERQKMNIHQVWIEHKLAPKGCTKLEILIVERARKLRKSFEQKTDLKEH